MSFRPTTARPPTVLELESPPTVMQALRAISGWSQILLLDSAAVRAPRGRYSFLMANPLRSQQRSTADFGCDPFIDLRSWSRALSGNHVTDLPPFQGGIAGMLSYELGGCWEQVPTQSPDLFQLPVLSAGLYPWVISWDHATGRAWIIAQGWNGDLSENLPQLGQQRVAEVAERLKAPVRDEVLLCHDATTAARERPFRLPHSIVEVGDGLWSDFSRDSYLQTLQRVIDYIYAGDIFQANLSQRLFCQIPRSLIDLYDELRTCNPAPFAGYYHCDDWAILSASPERFLHVADDLVTTRPIKGTRRRSTQAEADLFTRDSLRESAKDQAENVMIVDLLRNDLSRVCRPGSLCVPQLCDVETYATVQHLVSEVRGRLSTQFDVWDLLAATFPGGSITGAPKVRAMQIVAELEPTVRGPYTGSFFYVGHNGMVDSNLLIRTFVSRSGWLQCGVGGGIVADSDPETEYQETWHKAAGMLRAAGIARPQ